MITRYVAAIQTRFWLKLALYKDSFTRYDGVVICSACQRSCILSLLNAMRDSDIFSYRGREVWRPTFERKGQMLQGVVNGMAD